MLKKIDRQLRERAVRLVLEHRGEYPSNAKAIEAVRGALSDNWCRVVDSDIDGGEYDSAFDAMIQGCALEGVRPDDATPGIDNERWNGFYQTITA